MHIIINLNQPNFHYWELITNVETITFLVYKSVFTIQMWNDTVILIKTFFSRDKPFRNGNLTTPSFYVGKLHVPKEPSDTFLDMSAWGKVKSHNSYMHFASKKVHTVESCCYPSYLWCNIVLKTTKLNTTGSTLIVHMLLMSWRLSDTKWFLFSMGFEHIIKLTDITTYIYKEGKSPSLALRYKRVLL